MSLSSHWNNSQTQDLNHIMITTNLQHWTDQTWKRSRSPLLSFTQPELYNRILRSSINFRVRIDILRTVRNFCFDFLNQLPNGPVMSVYIGMRYVLITQMKTAGYTFHCALNHRGFCYVRDFECANWSHFPISFPGSSCPRPYCMVVVHPTTIVYIFTNKLSQLRHSGKRSDFPCSMSRR